MAAFEVIALDTATPQLRAPGASDTYTFPRAVEMPLGTANGVLYLDGSKAVTSGSALTFDTARLSFIKASNGRAWSADGDDLFAIENSASANFDFRTSTTGATYLMFSDTDARARGYVAYLHGSDSMLFGAAGTQKMRLDSTGLGIGTSSPSAKLTVHDANNIPIRIGDISAAPVSQTAVYVGASTSALSAGNGDLVLIPRTSDARSILFYTGNGTAAERMRLDSSGNLGLGVTPSAWLGSYKVLQLTGGAIQGGTSGLIEVYANNYRDSNGDFIYSTDGGASRYAASDAHRWFTAASGTAGNTISFTQAMTLDANGNLEIGGTFAQGRRLNVDSDNDGYTVSLLQTGAFNSGKLAGTVYAGYYDGSSITDMASIRGGKENTTSGNYAGMLAFYTRPNGGTDTEHARITSGGYFKASDDGTYTSSGSFHEVCQSTDNVGFSIECSNASLTTLGCAYIQADRNTTNNTFYALSYYNVGAAAYKFRVADSGDVTNTNGTYGTISDAKLKTDIVDAGSQWSDIKALRFRKFKMKADPDQRVQLGVVAQEVELTSPGLVDEHTDRDQEGNDLGTTTKSVKTSVLLMKAAVALQEAMLRIEALEAKVAALEA